MRRRRSLGVAVLSLLSAGFLSGCYEAASEITVSGTSAEAPSVQIRNTVLTSREGWINFVGYYPWDSGTSRTKYREGWDLARGLDEYIQCDAIEGIDKFGFWIDPYPKKARGRGYSTGQTVTSKTDLACKAKTGGYRITNTGDRLVITGAVAVPDIANFEESYYLKIKWDESWVLDETNGFRSYSENMVAWRGGGGSRIEPYAVLRPLEPGEIPNLQRISGFVNTDTLSEGLVPLGPEEPEFLAGVAAANESVVGQTPPEGYALVLNADGTVALVEEEQGFGQDWVAEALSYAALVLLGAGILSALFVSGVSIGKRAKV